MSENPSILISGNPKNELAIKTARRAIKILESIGAKTILDKNFLKAKDIVEIKKFNGKTAIVFGGDGTLLHFLRELGKKRLPVLGVNCGARGNLMQLNHGRIGAIKNILKKRLKTEKRTRIACLVGEREPPLAFNDVMIAPKRVGVLLRYDLFIDNEFQFRGVSDAVLFSTVSGSIAYSLSSGNVVAHKNARVLIIRPVNSLLHPQPIIVDESALIKLDSIDCAIGIEAIIDGQERIWVKKSIVLKKSAFDAILIKVEKEAREDSKHLQLAMPSAKYIFRVLKEHGSMKMQEIIRETGLNWRTTKRALQFLEKHEIVVREPLFGDKKQKLYSLR